jgi:hypothetical protein
VTATTSVLEHEQVAALPAVLGLLGVLVGATIALLTGWQSRRWAHIQWLLDKRHETYAELLRSMVALVDAGALADRDQRVKLHSDLFTASVRSAVVASEAVFDAQEAVHQDAVEYVAHGNDETLKRISEHGRTLETLMRADLTRAPRISIRH